MNSTRLSFYSIVPLALACLLGGPVAAVAEDSGKPKKAIEDRRLWRFEFDNDIVAGTDNAFTAGWSLQVHSPEFDTWDQKRKGKARKGFPLWIGRHIPGLDDGGEGGRVVRRAFGISQLMQTPEDIANPEPQPDDVPWAGTVGVYTSWSSFDNRRLGALQIYVGCMGPCSLAEQFQTFVHEDLGWGTPPEGWDNQLKNQALFNLNYSLRHKLAAPDESRYTPGVFTGDLAVGGQLGIGNYFRFVEAQLELRFGWSLPRGFTHIPDPPGRGIASDPTIGPPPRRWAIYFSLVPRYIYFDQIIMLEGGETDNGGYHPGVDYEEAVAQILAGFHMVKHRFQFHFTYYYYPEDPINTPAGSTLEWANFSFEYRF